MKERSDPHHGVVLKLEGFVMLGGNANSFEMAHTVGVTWEGCWNHSWDAAGLQRGCSETSYKATLGFSPAMQEGDELVPHHHSSPSVQVASSSALGRLWAGRWWSIPGLLGTCLQLSPSLLPAAAANGNDHSGAAARDTGCHAGIIHGVGSHGARALGMGVAARQRPAGITGHSHLMGEKRLSPWSAREQGLPVRRGPQGDVASVTLSNPSWGCPSTGQQLGTLVGVAAMRCQSQPKPPLGQQKDKQRWGHH